jgi:hypothetical protein
MAYQPGLELEMNLDQPMVNQFALHWPKGDLKLKNFLLKYLEGSLVLNQQNWQVARLLDPIGWKLLENLLLPLGDGGHLPIHLQKVAHGGLLEASRLDFDLWYHLNLFGVDLTLM